MFTACRFFWCGRFLFSELGNEPRPVDDVVSNGPWLTVDIELDRLLVRRRERPPRRVHDAHVMPGRAQRAVEPGRAQRLAALDVGDALRLVNVDEVIRRQPLAVDIHGIVARSSVWTKKEKKEREKQSQKKQN